MNHCSVPVPSVFPIFLSFCTVMPRSNFICQMKPSRLTSRDHPLRERVDDRNADAVEAAGDLVAAFAELRAGVQNRHDDFDRRQPLLGVHVDRNAASVVFDRTRTVFIQDDAHVVRVPRQRFVDGVVDRFVDELMQTALGGVADVHAGALAHGLKPAQDLDLFAGIVRRH